MYFNAININNELRMSNYDQQNLYTDKYITYITYTILNAEIKCIHHDYDYDYDYDNEKYITWSRAGGTTQCP